MESATDILGSHSPFSERVELTCPIAARATRIDSLMLNVGLRCDLSCAHCHQASSPHRAETMPRQTMLDSLSLAELLKPSLLDITGGEPTLWEHLPELIENASATGLRVRVRTNLVALAHPDRSRLMALFAKHHVEVLASLHDMTPHLIAGEPSDRLKASLGVLRSLGELGYGSESGPTLELAYNPPLGELPRPESELAEEFRDVLTPLGIRFNAIRVIANVPAGRYAEHLRKNGGYRTEIDRLAEAFNPAVLGDLGCRYGVELAWDGTFADCDFNLGAGLRVIDGPRTVAEALALAEAGTDVRAATASRRIAFGPHCFACATGAGSG